MIVKNESKIIERALDTIVKYIDYWVICDTGSTDNTPEIIKNYFKRHNIPGELHNTVWKDFGHNRSEALTYALNKSDYIILMDADMAFVALDPNFKNDLVLDSYELLQGQGFVYYNVRIINGRKPFKYFGVTHEYISAIFENCTRAQLHSVRFDDYGDGGNRPEKYTRDEKLLLRGLEEEKDPNIRARYMFYLAQTYHDMQNYAKSIEWYQKRIDAGGWYEEVYFAYYKIAGCTFLLGKSLEEVIKCYLNAYNYHKGRVEPIFWIIRLLNDNNRGEEALQFANLALSIKYPVKDLLFINKDYYDYRVKSEVARSAYMTGRFELASKLWKELIDENLMDDNEKKIVHYNYENIKKQLNENLKKPILCFYVGYTADINGRDYDNRENVYGSELALISLSEQLANYYEVFIFGASFHKEIEHKGVRYFNSNKLNEFMNTHEVEVMIVSRYVHYFLEFTANKPKKTYVWMHDMVAQPYWNGLELPRSAKYVVENMMPHIDGIIALSEWHKKFLLQQYNVNPNKIFIIGNAIDTSKFNKKVEKVKNRFIYTSAPNRGLNHLINYFEDIRKFMPDAQLYVYRGVEEFNNDFGKALITEMDKHEYIHFGGKLENHKVAEEFMKSEYWLYPTNWQETYCISSLEAQMGKCVCIASDLAALNTTVGDRGVLLKSSLYTEEYRKEVLDTLKDLMNNDKKRNELVTRGKEWAVKQTWDNRVQEWLDLFNYDVELRKQVLTQEKKENTNLDNKNLRDTLKDLPESPEHLSRPQVKVKLLCNYTDDQSLYNTWKKFCKQDNKWDNVTLTLDDNPDYYCIINHPQENAKFNPNKSIVFKMEEKESSRPYFPEMWVDIPYHHFMCCFDERQSLEWHLSKTYQELLTEKIEKTKVLSAVVSDQYNLRGHKLRVDFLKYVDDHECKLDLYGSGNSHNINLYIKKLPYLQKDEGLLPYKYTFAAESVSANGYFTEKLVDAILAECLCFYWGCPDLEKYIDHEAFIRLDLTKPEEAMRTMEEAVKNGEWEKRIDKIRAVKRKLLNEMQVMPTLTKIINDSMAKPDYYAPRMNDYWEYKEAHMPFHGDDNFMRLLNALLVASECGTFVETGCYRGASSGYVAGRHPDVLVYSCENNRDWYNICVENTSKYKNMKVFNQDSKVMLQNLSKDLDLDKPVIFYLDTASGVSNVTEDIKFITDNFKNYYIFVDDFKVPGKNYLYHDGDNKHSLDNFINYIGENTNTVYFRDYDETLCKYHPAVGWCLFTNFNINGLEQIGVKKQVHHNSKYKIKVLNLDRRMDRYIQFNDRADKAGLKTDDYTRVSAVDGEQLTLTPDIEQLFHVDDPENYVGKRVPRHHGFNAYVLGCAISHYNEWINLINDEESNEYDCLLMLEDDVIFDKNFKEKLDNTFKLLSYDDNWDLLYLGLHDDDGKSYDDYFVYNNIQKFTDAPRVLGGGTHAYCIRKKGARKLVELANKLHIQQPIDHWMIDQFDTLCVYKTMPYLTYAGMFQEGLADTDIQNRFRPLKDIGFPYKY
jgi:GR25 family glycosyltransferase involved in LPS biosynthesis/glycosyltransferase involved in cell wall biosynthesis